MTIPPSPSPSEAPPSTSAPAEPGGLGDRTPVRPEQTLPTANDQVWDIVSAGARTRHARPTHPDRRPARPSLPATSLGVSSFVREFVRLRYRDPRPHPSSARPKISCGGWGGGGGVRAGPRRRSVRLGRRTTERGTVPPPRHILHPRRSFSSH
jgi:hypothetical protein